MHNVALSFYSHAQSARALFRRVITTSCEDVLEDDKTSTRRNLVEHMFEGGGAKLRDVREVEHRRGSVIIIIIQIVIASVQFSTSINDSMGIVKIYTTIDIIIYRVFT